MRPGAQPDSQTDQLQWSRTAPGPPPVTEQPRSNGIVVGKGETRPCRVRGFWLQKENSVCDSRLVDTHLKVAHDLGSVGHYDPWVKLGSPAASAEAVPRVEALADLDDGVAEQRAEGASLGRPPESGIARLVRHGGLLFARELVKFNSFAVFAFRVADVDGQRVGVPSLSKVSLFGELWRQKVRHAVGGDPSKSQQSQSSLYGAPDKVPLRTRGQESTELVFHFDDLLLQLVNKRVGPHHDECRFRARLSRLSQASCMTGKG